MFERFSLEHDFKAIVNIGELGWAMVRSINVQDVYMDNDTPWNTPDEDYVWRTLTICMFAGHTKYTLKRNIIDLYYIAHRGWNKYVRMKLKQYKTHGSFTHS